MKGESRPLASVIVPVYRHQPYLEPALKSILALDYDPLEIIIQDDASPDDAFEAIKAVVRAYNGPHAVKVGRNDKNLSIGNLNVLMEKASGDYIIVAHDDDIQFPNRVSMIMDAFLRHDVSMVTSNAVRIDREGAEIGRDSQEKEDLFLGAEQITQFEWPKYSQGATLSWKRSVFDKFGPIDVLGTAKTSDYIIPFRAALLGSIYYLCEPTMYRRVHQESRGHIGRNTNDANILAVERESEHVTQWVYVLETLKNAVQANFIEPDRAARVEKNVVNSLISAATNLARSRNMLHLRKKRMAWIDHDAGAVTQLDMISQPINSLRDIEIIQGKRWYKVALKHPHKVKRWLRIRQLQKRYRTH